MSRTIDPKQGYSRKASRSRDSGSKPGDLCNVSALQLRDRFTFGESRMRSVETFLKHLPQARILDAVDQAFGKVPPPSSDDDRTFKYFCGICWGVIKTNRGEAAQ